MCFLVFDIAIQRYLFARVILSAWFRRGELDLKNKKQKWSISYGVGERILYFFVLKDGTVQLSLNRKDESVGPIIIAWE